MNGEASEYNTPEGQQSGGERASECTKAEEASGGNGKHGRGRKPGDDADTGGANRKKTMRDHPHRWPVLLTPPLAFTNRRQQRTAARSAAASLWRLRGLIPGWN